MLAGTAHAMGVPDLVNYQGVLRDAQGEPEDGDFDMRFRFFEADVAGNELLIDEHLAIGTGPVTVSGGLFNVALGGGNLLDGSGPGIFLTLSQVFGTEEEVYLVLEGRGRFRMGDEDVSVTPGHLLTVPARVEHRFHSIEEDLLLLVFFAPAEGSTEAKQGD